MEASLPPAVVEDRDDQATTPRGRFGRGKTVGLSFVAQSARLLGCRAKMLASMLMGAWVGRHAFRQVLMSLKRDAVFAWSQPNEEESTKDVFEDDVFQRANGLRLRKQKITLLYTMA